VLIRLGLSVVRDIDIRQTARPALESLSARLCETVHLAVLQDTNVLFLDCVESTKALRVASREGALLQAHCTSVGKALLAELTPEELRARYLNPSLPQLTQKSMTTRAALERELSTVRERGYAMNSGESEEGVSSVGVAIHDRSGRAIAAISAAAPISRLSKKQAREMARPVQQTAAEIELAAP